MDFNIFAKEHIPQITATAGLVTYALARKKLTIGGIFAGIVVALVHMIHPWPVFFWLLIAFFLFGTLATKVRYKTAFTKQQTCRLLPTLETDRLVRVDSAMYNMLTTIR